MKRSSYYPLSTTTLAVGIRAAAIEHTTRRNPLDHQELVQRLQELHAELESQPEMAPQARDVLQQLAQDIDGLLAKSEPEKQEEVGHLRERLTYMISTFEKEHPNLTSVLSQITDLLAHIGI